MSTLDPELDELLGDVPVASTGDMVRSDPTANLQKEELPSIERFEQAPNPIFLSEDYYSKVLTGEGEISQKIHSLLQNFLKETDPKQRGVHRNQLIVAWWEFAERLAENFGISNSEKRWTLRYSYLLPALLTADQRSMLAKILTEKSYDEPIHYLDEWIELSVSGKVNPLANEDLQSSRVSSQARKEQILNKTQGAKDAAFSLVNTLMSERKNVETSLESEIRSILSHNQHPVFPEIEDVYSPDQQRKIQSSINHLKKLVKLNTELNANIERAKNTDRQLGKIQDGVQQTEAENRIDKNLIRNEMFSIRQIIKLCVGKQGNHFPFLMKSFLCSSINLVATRENTIHCMRDIENIDPNIFKRTFKRRTMRIVPHTIIVPCFGDKGLCWEPFEFANRATSRGRIAIPMFPKDIKLAVIYALGDLRWNVAREKAAQYWMEEGLTGEYFQYFNVNYRGDVRLQFLEDYFLWITKEVEGIQKLTKEVRSIFWRYIPFPQSVKEDLRTRGFVYDTLYKKDVNRSLSDGY